MGETKDETRRDVTGEPIVWDALYRFSTDPTGEREGRTFRAVGPVLRKHEAALTEAGRMTPIIVQPEGEAADVGPVYLAADSRVLVRVLERGKAKCDRCGRGGRLVTPHVEHLPPGETVLRKTPLSLAVCESCLKALGLPETVHAPAWGGKEPTEFHRFLDWLARERVDSRVESVDDELGRKVIRVDSGTSAVFVVFRKEGTLVGLYSRGAER